MKLNIEIECTPAEARSFLGLPDLSPVHKIYIDRMTEMARDSVSPDLFAATLKSWAPMGEAGMRLWQQMFDQAADAKPKRT